MGNTSFILASIGVFLVVILLLVIILLVAKKYLSPSGNVNIEINGDKTINVPQGSSLMTTLNENGIFLPSACGGKASCGQCKVQVLEGGGEILDSEKPHFTRKQIKDHWRLGCQSTDIVVPAFRKGEHMETRLQPQIRNISLDSKTYAKNMDLCQHT